MTIPLRKRFTSVGNIELTSKALVLSSGLTSVATVPLHACSHLIVAVIVPLLFGTFKPQTEQARRTGVGS